MVHRKLIVISYLLPVFLYGLHFSNLIWEPIIASIAILNFCLILSSPAILWFAIVEFKNSKVNIRNISFFVLITFLVGIYCYGIQMLWPAMMGI